MRPFMNALKDWVLPIISAVYTKVDKDGKPSKIGVGMDKTGAAVLMI